MKFREDASFPGSVRSVLSLILFSILLLTGIFLCLVFAISPARTQTSRVFAAVNFHVPAPELWQAPDTTLIPVTDEGKLIRYGRDLIAHTAKYLGPQGSVRAISNGMNCQNCHLEAGTKPFGNNYAGVHATYPKYRARSGGVETIEKRINDCIERSLNGEKLDEDSREMRAIIAWFKWLGQDVPKDSVPRGTGLFSLPFLSRAADPAKGLIVYEKHCKSCHGTRGEGFKSPGASEWIYPPLAGSGSYNTGAGLYRLSRFAAYVKSNMPNGTTYSNPVLTDEEAWDVAAYVNSLPRPQKLFDKDWPDISKKPFDHPFGPYADLFSERQHKYGPFDVIAAKKGK